MANQEKRPHPPAQFFTNKSARCRMSVNVNPSDSPPLCFSKPPKMSTNYSPSLASSVRLSLASTSSNALLTHSSPSLRTTSKLGTNCKLGTVLLRGTLSSIASSRSSLATLPPKGDVILTSSSLALIICNNERRT